MRALLAASAISLFLAGFAGQAGARIERPMGRAPRVPSRLAAPRFWVERTGLFSLRRPSSDAWRFDGTLRDPEGDPIPLFAHSEESGATLSVQSADGVPSPKALAKVLAERLGTEENVHVETPRPLTARGGEAYTFTFTTGQESRGRVAVVPAGEHLVLIVASWPLGSPAQVSEDVEAMIASVGPAEAAAEP